MTQHAIRFIEDALARGPKPAAEVIERAAAQGISKHCLYRARAACNATTTRIAGKGGAHGDGYWLWSIPKHDTPPPGPDLETLNQEQGRGLLDQDFKDANDPSSHECGSDQETG